MASTKKDEMLFEEEMKIPVFTVLKNGSILKNIFVINRPTVAAGNAENPYETSEEILTIGRHPDCSIVLTHPSISRFHLQINSNPSSHNLSVMDLSSVHGTWVSDRRIEPGARVDLKEGDTLRFGGSTRVYRLHWIPVNQAYDVDQPFVPKLNESLRQEKEDEIALFKDENSVFDESNGSEEKVLSLEQKEETCQDGNHLSVENSHSEDKEPFVIEQKEDDKCQEHRSLLVENKQIEENEPSIDERKYGDTFRGINSFFPLDNSEVVVQMENPSAATIPENPKTSFSNKDWNDNSGNGLELTDTENLWCGPALTELMDFLRPAGVIWETGDEKILNEIATEEMPGTEHTESPETIGEEKDNQEAEIPEEAKRQNPTRETLKDAMNITSLSSGPLEAESMTTFLSVGGFSETKFAGESQSPESLMVYQLSSTMRNTESPKTDRKTNSLVHPLEACLVENGQSPAAAQLWEEMESKVISRNNQKEISSPNSIPFATESVNSSQPVEHVHLNITDVKFNKENQKTPQSRFAGEGLCRRESLHSPAVKSENKHSDIWSRRGKSRGVLQIQTDNSRAKIKKANVDAEDEVQNEDTENRSITKALFSSLDWDEEEVFTPDKENLTPNTLLLKSLKRKGMLEEIKHLNSNKSCFSKVAWISNVNPEEDVLTASDKENQTPKILQEKKPAKATSLNQARLEKEIVVTKKNAERVPFQSIHVNSAGKSKSQASLRNSPLRKSNTVTSTLAMEKIANVSNNTFGNGKIIWNMVVDTTTLLNKESMKSLKLLQGLKGTHLVIPTMVLWELDYLKRRGYLFRSNAKVGSALEWIEECMSETKWWIHVQNSLEDGRLIAKTPLASPQQFCASSGMLSARGSLTEVFSPTAEDHIVECTILLQKMNNDGHLVLLSNDTNAKIKAMAEGLICETAEEFRESLVNPFSERFLWADSSPRGQTWSHLDDVVLWERYQHLSTKKPWNGEGGAKGLKLILMHNSGYGYSNKFSIC